MTEDYAPFPEAELLALAKDLETNASQWKGSTPVGAIIRARDLARAKFCRDAVAAHAAVRERMLIAEMDNRQAKAS